MFHPPPYFSIQIFALIGEQFQDVGDEICGVVISTRFQEDILSVSLLYVPVGVYDTDLEQKCI